MATTVLERKVGSTVGKRDVEVIEVLCEGRTTKME